jgi:acetyltransferase-like isoleucine patch superfamily enzyme
MEKTFKDNWKLGLKGHADLWTLHKELRTEIEKRWQRSLPFSEELFDRWERAATLGFGEQASIYDMSFVMGDVKVGKGTWIGPFTMLDGRGGLSIGSYCSISAGVQVYSHDTVKWALTGGKAAEERSPTKIEDFCYIGPLSIISRGVTIGRNSLIGANSFVRTSIPANTIAAGSPARIIGKVVVEDADVRLVYDND